MRKAHYTSTLIAGGGDWPDNHVVFKGEAEAVANDLHAPVDLLQEQNNIVEPGFPDEKTCSVWSGEGFASAGMVIPKFDATVPTTLATTFQGFASFLNWTYTNAN